MHNNEQNREYVFRFNIYLFDNVLVRIYNSLTQLQINLTIFIGNDNKKYFQEIPCIFQQQNTSTHFHRYPYSR